MQQLVPVSTRSLGEADAAFYAGWLPRARSLYESLVEHAATQGDRALEATGRAMLARCLLRRRDAEGAREQLRHARRVLGDDLAAEARVRGAEVRLRARESAGEPLLRELDSYYRWASEHSEDAAFDAAQLLADHTADDARIDWYRRAVDHGRAAKLTGRLATVCHALAATLEAQGQLEEAISAYQTALRTHGLLGDRRQIVASHWAIGNIAARREDWLLAQEQLDRAIATASDGIDCEDLLALALADLSTVHRQWGDDIEARRLLLQALAVGREIALAQRWPERWDAMLGQARELDLDA